MINQFESRCHSLSQKKPLLVAGEGVHGNNKRKVRS
jgi:hypothetical protein